MGTQSLRDQMRPASRSFQKEKRVSHGAVLSEAGDLPGRVFLLKVHGMKWKVPREGSLEFGRKHMVSSLRV